VLKFIGKVAEEVIIQRLGNTLKQGNVNVFLAENPMDMRAGAANVLRQLCGRNTLLPHYLFDMLPDVHKKAWNLFNLPSIGFPRPPYQQVIPRQKMASHNGFLIWYLRRDIVEIDAQEYVFEMLFYMIMCLF
jgi:hypothetical protein